MFLGVRSNLKYQRKTARLSESAQGPLLISEAHQLESLMQHQEDCFLVRVWVEEGTIAELVVVTSSSAPESEQVADSPPVVMAEGGLFRESCPGFVAESSNRRVSFVEPLPWTVSL